MPTYERLDDAGAVVERSVTFAGTDHDAQLSHAAASQDSPWQRTDEIPVEPVFVEPSTPDGGDAEQNKQQDDESDVEPSDEDTEE